MTVYISDHNGTLTSTGRAVRPVHVGAVLCDPSQWGQEPDCRADKHLSAETAFADLRGMYYALHQPRPQSGYVAIMQYRRMFFLGGVPFARPELWKTWNDMRCTLHYEHRVKSKYLAPYVSYLSKTGDKLLPRFLGAADMCVNHFDFVNVTLEAQYISTIKALYPEDPRYLHAWSDLRAVLSTSLGGDLVDEVCKGSQIYANNAFVTTWEEFQRYGSFLFATLDALPQYRDVFRLYGYLGERIQTAYIAMRQAEDPTFTVSHRPMMFFY